jgi:Uma2 family endonuclease
MGSAVSTKKRYTPEAYFELLTQSEDKWEYEDGLLVMMAGGTPNHNRVKADLGIYIGSRLKKCRPFDSDQAVSIPRSHCYFFPDLTYVCGPEDEFEESAGISRLLNPTVIVEVLSENTEARDRGDKFHAYFSLPSVREYLLIDSRQPRVDVYSRDGERQWHMQSYYSLDQEVEIRSLDLHVPLAAIYQRVDWPEEPLGAGEE